MALFAQNVGSTFVEIERLKMQIITYTWAVHMRACVLLVVVDDIAEAVIGRVSRGWPHHKIVRVQVLEEVGSTSVKVVVAPHLDELSTHPKRAPLPHLRVDA